jgi:sortase A
LGILCLTTAIGLAGHLGWLLWGTGLVTARAQRDLRADLELRIQARAETVLVSAEPLPAGQQAGDGSPGRPGASASGSLDAPTPPLGEALAILQIPRMDLDVVVVEGTGTEELKRGPGHYPLTAMPWQDAGRVGIAGHRTTYGQPFWSLDRLQVGDAIHLSTEVGSFDYRVTRVFVVDDSEGWVLNQTRRPTLVLTTCNPRFSSSQRLIVFADRV